MAGTVYTVSASHRVPVTRRKVFAYAARHGIEIDIEGRGARHVHAYAPDGRVFAGSTCDNAGCGNYEIGEPIDWQFVWDEIQLSEGI